MSLKRIQKEWRDSAINRSPFYYAEPITESDMYHWEGFILGPIGSPYEGGKFLLSITFPKDYPFRPPIIKFQT